MTILNQSNINYQSVLPDGSISPGSRTSNIVTTEVITYSFTKIKSTEKFVISEGETSVQTVVLTNTSAFQLTDVFFRDIMTDGATYVPGSVTIEGVIFPTYDPFTGFALPNIASGQSLTITYQIVANNPKTSSPVLNRGRINYTVQDPVRGGVSFAEDSNVVAIEVVAQSISLSVQKIVDKTIAQPGEALHYTAIITNNGAQTLANLSFIDALDSSLIFVPNSVTINGINFPGLNPSVGFALPSLAASSSHTVEFDVVISPIIIANAVQNIAITRVLSGELLIPFPSNIVVTIIQRISPPLISHSRPISIDCLPCQINHCCSSHHFQQPQQCHFSQHRYRGSFRNF